MPATLDEVKDVIDHAFQEAQSQLELDGDRIFGEIKSPEFQGMGHEDRNKLVTERVRKTLGLNGVNLGMLVPLAPDEQIQW